MKKLIMILTMALVTGGCATLSRPGGILYQSGQKKKLARAVMLLETGKTSAAAEVLAALAAEPAVPGVTDEALFRLGLLRLATGQAQKDLERLKKEYPSSSWAPLASQLIEILTLTDDLRQQNRKMKEQTLSLTKENKELRDSIEKLKELELELGKRKKR